MSGFIANGPVPSGHINSDPFWPTIELEHVRANLRIDSSVDPARLEVAVIAAVISVNRELRAWRLEKIAAGYAELAQVPSDKVRDTSELVQLYLRAVQSATAAEVAERYRW
ncbi:head completion/stabilization protein, partial [Pseudomonas aeruginosa]